MAPVICFYGHFSGYSSYPTVCRAIARVLHDTVGDRVVLCDLRPDGSYDGLEGVPRVTEEYREGVLSRARLGRLYDARRLPGTGLLFGFPEWSFCIPKHEHNIGYHVCDLDRIPEHWVEAMNAMDEVLTPSFWCRDVFRANGVAVPVTVVPHGVEQDTTEGSTRKTITFLHFCSAETPDRKGTIELVRAFVGTRISGSLVIYTTSSAVRDFVEDVQDSRVCCVVEPPRTIAEQYRLYKTAKVVVQPSRAEGFGMIPLEALACGVPVVATVATGHKDFLDRDTPGLVEVPTTGLSRCAPGPGRAPGLSVWDVRNALLYAMDKYDTLLEAAGANAAGVQEEWSWHRVLQPLVGMVG